MHGDRQVYGKSEGGKAFFIAGFIKLQIRLLSIDKQNSYAIIAVKENDNKRE